MSDPKQPVYELIGPAVSGSPLPTSITVASGSLGSVKLVVMQVSTPAGVNTYYMAPDMAEEVSKHIARSAAEARSGIVLASELPKLS